MVTKTPELNPIPRRKARHGRSVQSSKPIKFVAGYLPDLKMPPPRWRFVAVMLELPEDQRPMSKCGKMRTRVWPSIDRLLCKDGLSGYRMISSRSVSKSFESTTESRLTSSA